MSIHINNWQGLQVAGINALTGEACKYSMRLLCDLNEDGIDLVRDFFGMQIVLNPKTQFTENWNSFVNEKPALVSIMLPRGIFDDLCHFALFRMGCVFAVKTGPGCWAGYSAGDVTKYNLSREMLEEHEGWHVHFNPTPAASGSRNQHAFTGRID